MIATSAARLGMAASVRTALNANEALAHLTAEPAEVILADTALSRPDSAEFTRRMLTAAPGAAVVLFGPEEPRNAAAAIAAGARGVIRGDHADAVTLVTKALLLLLGQPRASVVAQSAGVPAGAAAPIRATVVRPPAHLPPAPAVIPSQPASAHQSVPQQRGDIQVEPPHTDRPRRRVDLTERELQVLRGMADGKSNAEIGRELFVSEDTVKTHARRLFRKLGARDRAHAVASAFRAGLVS
jgi:DNA-binding NarL/FixJ family response regulator